jgi:DNA-binding MarR family transcriptional regulator
MYAQKQGISYGIIDIVYLLRLHGAVTQKQIAETCKMPKQTVNSFIKQLKSENYIFLVPTNTEDKREKEIRLTSTGERYSLKLLKPFFELHEQVAGRVGMEVLRQLSNTLNTLGDALERELEIEKASIKWEEKMKTKKELVKKTTRQVMHSKAVK